MSYTEEYLDKMLNFVIKHHDKTKLDMEKIPEGFLNLDDAVNKFRNALEYETHVSLQEGTNKSDNPILYSVNLETEEPGIIIGSKPNKDELLVYTKVTNKIEEKKNKKPKKQKSIDQIEDEAVLEMEKLQKKIQEDIDYTDNKNKKTKVKDVNKNIKKDEKEIENFEKKSSNLLKKIQDLEKLSEKYPKKKSCYQEKIQNNNQVWDDYQDKIKEYTENCTSYRNNIHKDIESIEKYDVKQQIKKQERELKKKENLEKKKEKPEKKLNEKENIEKNENDQIENLIEKKEIDPDLDNTNIEPKQKLPEKNIIVSNELDILDEFYELENNKKFLTEKKQISLENSTIYPSPVPLERHISSLENSNPHPILLPILLYGKYTELDNGNSPITIYHGPPGTGKTHTIISELKKILETTSKGRILICAPSNIGVINLYKRALNSDINGRLILSNNQLELHKDLPIIDEKKINKRIYFSTISMRYGKSLKDVEFSTIFIDEAAQCPESLCWGLLKRSVTQLYMSGDPCQLPALVSKEGVKFNYGRSLMERLMELDYPSILLDTQRRMHPKIAGFSNEYFYNNELKTDYSYNFNIDPFIIYNIEGTEKSIGTSYNNEKENKKVIELVKDLKKQFNEIVIISPYNAQCNALKSIDNTLEVHTVDSYQGREAEAIILTTVRTGNTIGFWEDYRRLNVAMTRARHALRIIGKTQTWTATENPLKKLFYYALENGIQIVNKK